MFCSPFTVSVVRAVLRRRSFGVPEGDPAFQSCWLETLVSSLFQMTAIRQRPDVARLRLTLQWLRRICSETSDAKGTRLKLAFFWSWFEYG